MSEEKDNLEKALKSLEKAAILAGKHVENDNNNRATSKKPTFIGNVLPTQRETKPLVLTRREPPTKPSPVNPESGKPTQVETLGAGVASTQDVGFQQTSVPLKAQINFQRGVTPVAKPGSGVTDNFASLEKIGIHRNLKTTTSPDQKPNGNTPDKTADNSSSTRKTSNASVGNLVNATKAVPEKINAKLDKLVNATMATIGVLLPTVGSGMLAKKLDDKYNESRVQAFLNKGKVGAATKALGSVAAPGSAVGAFLEEKRPKRIIPAVNKGANSLMNLANKKATDAKNMLGRSAQTSKNDTSPKNHP